MSVSLSRLCVLRMRNINLGLLDVVVRCLDQLEQDVVDVLADVAGLGQGGRVGDRERHVEQPGQRLG